MKRILSYWDTSEKLQPYYYILKCYMNFWMLLVDFRRRGEFELNFVNTYNMKEINTHILPISSKSMMHLNQLTLRIIQLYCVVKWATKSPISFLKRIWGYKLLRETILSLCCSVHWTIISFTYFLSLLCKVSIWFWRQRTLEGHTFKRLHGKISFLMQSILFIR